MTKARECRQRARPCRGLLLLAASLWLAGCAWTAPRGSAADAAIRALLARQVAAWNRGDIDGYMQAYLQAEELRIASGARVLAGFDASLAAYRAAFPDPVAMGTLEFGDLVVESLGGGHALAFGRWRLRAGGTERQGLFSLVLARTIDGWRIARDHTSAGQARLPAARSTRPASRDSATAQ